MSHTLQNLTQLAIEIVRAAPFAVVVVDGAGVVRTANLKAVELLSDDQIPDPVRSAPLIGEAFESVLPGLDLDRAIELSTPTKARVPSNNRSIELECVRLDSEGACWTVCYFNEVNKQRQRELLLEKEASTDELSGLANRRAFQRTMEANQHRSLSLAIVDVDKFKSVNDTHGHLAGDDVVRHVADLLRQSFEESAILVSRMGGDEFSVLFETTDAESVVSLLEKSRLAISETDVPDQNGIRITVSIGVAVSTVPKIGTRTLLTYADQQLYRAKNAGRNQTAQISIDNSLPGQ